MNTITNIELDILKAHLIKKPFKYQEVFLEVLDHYATAYEQADEELTETMDRLDLEFTATRVQQINQQYIKELNRQIGKSYLTVFANYFRWPQLLVSVMVVMIFLMAAPVLHTYKPLKATLLIVFGMLPMIVTIFYGIKTWRSRIALPGKLSSGYHATIVLLIVLSSVYLQVNSYYRVFSQSFEGNILDVSQYLTAGLLLFGLILCSTVFQVFWTKVRSNIA